MISRFSIAAWVGAASLFVVTGITEVRSPTLDSGTKAALAVLRFPSYYAFGFALVVTTLVCGFAARHHQAAGQRAMRVCLGLLTVAFVLMVIDYVWIYRPLHEMLVTVESERPAHFEQYHQASKWINCLDVSLCLVAALLLCWPHSPKPAELP